MAKTRVYELARELKIESRLLLSRLQDMGISVASHQSTVTDAQADEIRKKLHTGGATVNKKAAPKVIRRRRVATKEPQESLSDEDGQEESSTSAVMRRSPTLQDSEESSPEPSVISGKSDARVARSLSSDRETDGEEKVAPADKFDAKEAHRTGRGGEAILGKDDAAGISDQEEGQKTSEFKPEKSEANDASAAQVEVDGGESPAPRPAGGARIVRRATPEEVANSKLAAERAAEARRTKRPRKPGPDASSGVLPVRQEGSSTRAKSDQAPDVVDLAAMPLESVDSHGRRQGKGKKKPVDEEAPAAKRAAFVKPKRDGFNTRRILESTEIGIGDEALPRAVAKKKMVYTPSAQNKRRDHKRRKDLKKTEVTTPRAAYRVVKMGDEITVADLGKQLGVKAAELISKLVGQGVMVTINQNIDFDTASLIASEYNFEVHNNKVSVDDLIAKGHSLSQDAGNIVERPPIVTIMGHVDHGKTSILDAIRKAKVAHGEAGGITQHIGAYSVSTNSGKRVSFLDTPGHEAFSAMRQRGAKVTDIVVLVVAADDGVMPQTVEAISHARDAEVPIIVAINKIDKPNVNFDRVYTELTEHGVQSEEWGGDTQFVKVSALEGTGLDDLLEAIALQAEVLELRARVDGDAQGIVVEAHLDGGRGPVATVMVQEGCLKVGDLIVAGQCFGKVRAMLSDHGSRLSEAGPSTPVEVIGLDSVPMAGDPVHKFSDDKVAKDVISLRKREGTESGSRSAVQTLDALLGRVKDEERPVVPVILKGDTQGSVEAIAESIGKLNSERVENKIVHKAVGGITESDLRLASTSGAVIIGFNVRLGRGLSDLADRYGVPIKYFSVIYEVVDAVKALMAGTLPPIQTEVIQGHGEVRQCIKVPKFGVVAGTAITDGKVTRNSHMRLIRDDVVIFSGKIGSLRRFKDDVKEVSHGYECGIGIEGYNDIREGDVIESFVIEEEVATL